jgi:hypothetical protein
MWFRVTVLASWLLSVLVASSAAQVTPEIREVMQSRLEAVWTKDAPTWSRLTADEFTVVVPEGQLMTKSDRLAALKAESHRLFTWWIWSTNSKLLIPKT